MAGQFGMDVSEVRSAAAELNRRAADLAETGVAVRELLEANQWVGPSAEGAHAALPEYLSNLDAVRRYLEEIAAAMVNAAQEQEAVSGS